MTFLAPAALFGLALLALPVVVHLLRPRKMRQTPFSSLRWLKVTRQRLSRRIQWHQWLLFALRAAMIVLFVLALAKPVFDLWSARGPVDRVIIVDAGRVMAYEPNDGPSPFERAKTIAARLVEHGSPGDRTAILVAGGTPKVIAPLTADAGAHLPKLRATVPQAGEASVTAVLPMLPALLGPPANRDVELTFVTSNQRHAWQQAEVQAMVQTYGAKVRVQVIDVGPGAVVNAWIASARLIDRGAGEDRVLRVEVGSVGSTGQSPGVRLTGIDGLGDDVRDVALTPGQAGWADFAIPASLPLAGKVAELRLEPGDALASDDRYFFNFDMAWALRLLLVEPARNTPRSGHGLYLRTALDALAASGNHSFRLTTRSAASVAPADVRDADVVILAGVPKLTEDVVAGLEQRVRGGAGLIAFLGPQIDADFYRQQMFKPAQRTDRLLPLRVKAPPQSFVQGRPDELRQIRWSHPMLAPLRDPLLGDVGLCQFLKHAAFDAAPDLDGAVLARFEDSTPALVDRPFGAGRVLLWNTTADDTWSDLPRRRCFVPLVDRMLAYLAAGGVRRQFIVGTPINLPVADVQPGDRVRVIGPDGGTPASRLVTVGTQTLLHLDAVDIPGVYRAVPRDDSAKAWPFVVNAGRDASPLTPMDPATLAAWWSPASFELLGGDAALARLDAETSAWSFWPVLIVLAGLFLLAETIYVYRLCPHGNPTAASSIVPQRGILKPTIQ